MKRLEGKVAGVTGGGRGIGRAICLRLAQEGARVAVMDRADASETAALCRAAGGEVVTFRLDVTSKTEVQQAVAGMVTAWGMVFS